MHWMKRDYDTMANTQAWKVEDFPCTLYVPPTLGMTGNSTCDGEEHGTDIRRQLNIPFPSSHYASTALRALAVDAELSPLVRRSFSLASDAKQSGAEQSILVVDYAATTNRMLRVAVNGFFESVGVVIGVMKDLDVDVVHEPVRESLEGVQGLVVEGVEGRG
jgi:EKC/KEOPS complex subunit PCC1/LAGE3